MGALLVKNYPSSADLASDSLELFFFFFPALKSPIRKLTPLPSRNIDVGSTYVLMYTSQIASTQITTKKRDRLSAVIKASRRASVLLSGKSLTFQESRKSWINS